MIYHPSDSGTVMQAPPPDPGSNKYNDGTVVTLTALGSNPYLFDHWGTDLSGSTNPTTITMNSDKQVDVYFTLPPPIIDAFGAIPASLQKGGNINLSWMTQYADQVTLFLNDVNQGAYDGQTSSFTVTITQTTVAYIVAEGSGGSTTSEKVTITVGDSPALPLPTTNIGDNWILLIIAIAAILLGLFLFIRWVKKPKAPLPEKKSWEKKKFDIKQLIKRR
jgi:LPXTG-motif cell wall-anchored protein